MIRCQIICIGLKNEMINLQWIENLVKNISLVLYYPLMYLKFLIYILVGLLELFVLDNFEISFNF